MPPLIRGENEQRSIERRRGCRTSDATHELVALHGSERLLGDVPRQAGPQGAGEVERVVGAIVKAVAYGRNISFMTLS